MGSERGIGGGGPISAADTEGLPPTVAADLLEAARCCSSGAYRGAALLARRTVEQVVVTRRVPLEMRTFQHKVGWLLADGHLPPAFAADARTVRDVGAAAAHGSDPITGDEAVAMVRSALAIARAVLLPNG